MTHNSSALGSFFFLKELQVPEVLSCTDLCVCAFVCTCCVVCVYVCVEKMLFLVDFFFHLLHPLVDCHFSPSLVVYGPQPLSIKT